MSSLSICSRKLGQTVAPDEFRNIGKDGGDVFVAPVDVVASRKRSNLSRSRDAELRHLRHWSPVLVLPEDVADRTKNVLRELLRSELIRLELVTPLERRDHHVGRVLHV